MLDSSSRLRKKPLKIFFTKRQAWDSETIATTLPYWCWIPQLLVDNIPDGFSLFSPHWVCSALYDLQLETNTGGGNKAALCPRLCLSTWAKAPAPVGQSLRWCFQQLSRRVPSTSLWQQRKRGAHPYSKCPGPGSHWGCAVTTSWLVPEGHTPAWADVCSEPCTEE